MSLAYQHPGDTPDICNNFVGVYHMEGTVKWFNDAKGYGFITADDGVDVFVHHSAIVADGFRTLEANERVRFEINQGPKGPQAANVVRLEG